MPLTVKTSRQGHLVAEDGAFRAEAVDFYNLAEILAANNLSIADATLHRLVAVIALDDQGTPELGAKPQPACECGTVFGHLDEYDTHVATAN